MRNPPNFDPIARFYRWAEYVTFGGLLRRVRTHFLAEVADTRQALLLGDGDGRFTRALLRSAPRTHAMAVDTSHAMLRLLQGRCARDGNAARLRVVPGSALELHRFAAIPDECDLVVTHFFLDCLSQAEVEALTLNLAAVLKPGCRWLLSDFGLPRSGAGRWLAQACIRSLYLVFRLLTGLKAQRLPNAQMALHAAGFLRYQRREWWGGFLYGELWVLS